MFNPRLHPALTATAVFLLGCPSWAGDPVLVDTYPNPPGRMVSYVRVFGRTAFVASQDSRLSILNVRDDGSLTFATSVTNAMFQRRDLISLSSEKCFLGVSKTVYALDISDIHAPWIIGTYGLRDYIQGVAAIEDDLLIMTSQGCYPVSFLTSTNLQRLGRGITLDTSPVLQAVAQGSVVYMTTRDGLRIYDFAVRSNPQLLSSIPLTNDIVMALAVDGSRVGLACASRQLFVIDAEDLRSPVILGSYLMGGNPRELALAGTLAVVAQEAHGCEIIDFAEAQNPASIARVPTSGLAMSVAVSGPFLFVTDSWVGLLVLRCDRSFPPRLLDRPQSQLVHAGDPCTFTIQADGWSTPTFQWQRNGINLIDGTGCSGANSPTLALASTSEADQGTYRVVVSSDGVFAMSSAATLTVSRLRLLGKSHYGFVNVGLMLADDATVSGAAAGAYHDLTLHTDGTVRAAGKSFDGQTNVPPSVRDAIAVAAGYDHSLALLADGTVVAWGRNSDGQTDVPQAATNVVAIAAGWAHSLALGADGSVIAWGNNEYGQCTVDYRANDITAIAAGYYHSLALRTDGRVIAWGIDESAPDWATNVTAIAGGWWHSLAVKADGTVVSWGDDTYGQTQVPSSATNVVSVSAGFYHSVAQRKDGTAVAWGKNAFRMVDGVSRLRDTCLLYAGEDHSLALMSPDIPLVSPPPQRVVAPLGGIATFSAQVRASPLSTLQWLHQSIPIAGATNRSITVHACTELDAGDYQLVITSPEGLAITRPTSLQILGIPPAVLEMPAVVAVGDGRTEEFGATVTGSQPMTYQWFRSGLAVPGATNRILLLSPAAVADSGAYTLQVANRFGSDARGETLLTVFPSTDPNDIAAALDCEDLLWTTSPDSPWTLTSTFTFDGIDALQSGPLTFGRESWIQTTVSGPAILEWTWRIPAAGIVDGSCRTLLTLESDTLPSSGTWKTLRALSGPRLWEQWLSHSVVLGAGGHTLRWFFEYSHGTPTETDRAFVDQVRLSLPPSISARLGTNSTLIHSKRQGECILFNRVEAVKMGA